MATPRAHPVVPNQDYLVLSAVSFPKATNSREVRVLCGDNPPTLTAGYAIWQVIPRPLFQGITVPQGFDPAQLKCELRFGVWDGQFGFNGWDTGNAAGQFVEEQLNNLHWMAGGNALAGASPSLTIRAIAPNTDRLTPLVPPQYKGVEWVVNGGIEYNKSLRNGSGLRIYQDVTVTLLGYLGIGLKPQHPGGTQAGGYFKTTFSTRTILAIASAPSSRSINPEHLAHAIKIHHNNNPVRHRSRIRLSRMSIVANLPIGIDIWVPAHPR